MSDTLDAKGQCLCGAVSIDAQSLNRHIHACHCGMCRNWGGGPLLALECEGDVSIEGAGYISLYESSEWAQRGFCKQCGSHLFYQLKKTQQYFFPVGLFDLDEELLFDQQIFIDKKPLYYHFANDTQNLSEAEVFARLGDI